MTAAKKIRLMIGGERGILVGGREFEQIFGYCSTRPNSLPQ